MSKEIDLTKATAETVAALTEASGALEPAQKFWAALARRIDYYFYPRTVQQAQRAAKLIEASGLPRLAYEEVRRHDALLGAILEGGTMESDEGMQELWANLLANVLIDGSARVDRTFPDLLRRLEPIEVATLDALAEHASFSLSPEECEFKPAQLQRSGIDGVGLDNLIGLMLLRYTREMATTLGTISDAGTTVAGATFTNLGWVFVQACREPRPTD